MLPEMPQQLLPFRIFRLSKRLGSEILSQYPKVNTDRFKNSYINRLIFKYNLAM